MDGLIEAVPVDDLVEVLDELIEPVAVGEEDDVFVGFALAVGVTDVRIVVVCLGLLVVVRDRAVENVGFGVDEEDFDIDNVFVLVFDDWPVRVFSEDTVFPSLGFEVSVNADVFVEVLLGWEVIVGFTTTSRRILRFTSKEEEQLWTG